MSDLDIDKQIFKTDNKWTCHIIQGEITNLNNYKVE